MLSRRRILAGSAAMLATHHAPIASARSGPLRFGIVADPQYVDAPPNRLLNRYFRESLAKLREAIATFNAHELQFVVTFGDLIDRDWTSYDAILPLYDGLRHEKVTLLGNHDFAVEPVRLGSVPERLGLARTYDDFAVGGFRFIALDGNDVSLFAPPLGDGRWQIAADRLARLSLQRAPNAKPWNGSLGEDQFAWLAERLDAARDAGEPVVVLNHHPVYPDDPHNMWDAQRLVDLLTCHANVVAYLCGHNHAGNYGQTGGVHFVNFAGMVDTTENAYALVDLTRERLDIRGFGREASRSLELKPV